MKSVFRPFAAIVLGLMLVLTGQSMAVARGAAAATGEMVICTGAGTVTVYTDAGGNPTSAPHICPECIAAVLLAIVPVAPSAVRPARTTERPWPITASVSHTALRPTTTRSRAPPVLI
ncbi:hypothetical protein [uncultured Roseobacter sp.]|uniref:DUF2946 family protein n=1 Tax=uncultured Roseobacter sp. TaxID=114847 RepID=UPI00261DD23A|nr:hypothetical protein [uncultured Roseobacter sp.]